MKSAVILATLALAFGSPLVTSSPELAHFRRDDVTIPEFLKSAVTNAKQTVDTLVEQLKRNDGHAAEDTVDAVITGLDSQIDNLADLITKDLNGVTFGLSGALGDFLLGPIFQGITNGAEVIISNVVGGSIDMVSDGALKAFTKSIGDLHSLGEKIDVSKTNLQKLDAAQKQLEHIKGSTKKEAKKASPSAAAKGKRDDVTIPEFLKSAITNAKQTVDTLVEQLKRNDGHAAEDTVDAVITGLDSQVDNLADMITKDLNGVTFGLSGALGDFLLGPIFQGITNGAEVIISNVVGGSIDMVSDGAIKELSKTVSNLRKIGNEISISATNMDALDKVQKQLAHVKGSTKKDAKKASPSAAAKGKRDDVTIPEFLKSAITNAKQTVDTLVEQLKRNDGHAAEDTVDAVITGLDSQVDNLADLITKDLNGVTFGLSGALGDFLLGPIFQGITNGAEVIISNVVGGSIDMVSDGAIKELSKTVSNLRKIGNEISISATNMDALDKVQKQLAHVKGSTKKDAKKASPSAAAKGKRDDVTIPEFVKSAITNAKQTVDTLVEQLKRNDGHAAEDTVDAVITGLDSQVDNLADMITKDLNGVTFGLSGALGDFLLGPIFQGITNGAEVIISNVVGGSIDMVSDGAIKELSKTVSNLRKIGNEISISATNMNALDKTQKDLAHLKAVKKDASKTVAHKAKPSATEAAAVEKRASDADLSGVQGSVTNYKQVLDTLNSQLKSHNGHAAQATINAFITGADSQIDNAVATVSDALAPFTLGISKAIGDVLLGPFVQSVTNGAEVLVSNLLGGAIDGVADASVAAYSQSLNNLVKVADKYGVNAETKNALAQAQQRLASVLPKQN